jgi:hypothetical protein
MARLELVSRREGKVVTDIVDVVKDSACSGSLQELATELVARADAEG